MALRDYLRSIIGPHEPVSKEFEHMLMREVMRTELIRIKALIAVALVIIVNTLTIHRLFPEVVDRVWHGVDPNAVYRILIGLILFELWVYTAISNHLKRDQDLKVYRRYLGAFIEIS